MSDMLEQNDEIQEILSRNYSCQDVDDADLEAEFDGLGDYVTDGRPFITRHYSPHICQLPPDILDDALAPPSGAPSVGVPAAPAAAAGFDDFGLPVQVPAT